MRYTLYEDGELIASFEYKFDAKMFGAILEERHPSNKITYIEVSQ